jgi:hypothetical protein
MAALAMRTNEKKRFWVNGSAVFIFIRVEFCGTEFEARRLHNGYNPNQAFFMLFVAIPPDPATDPLASQGALVFGPGNQFLFAVNAGSNQISVLRVRRTGLDFG